MSDSISLVSSDSLYCLEGGAGAGGFRIFVRRFFSNIGPKPFPPPVFGPLGVRLPLDDGTVIVGPPVGDNADA